MSKDYIKHITETLKEIKANGLYKDEYSIASPQDAHIELEDGSKLINMCANNYLGLSSHPDLIKAAKKSYEDYGYGLSSVRFICGTQTVHKQLEKSIAGFLSKEDAILYSSCFDANAGLFETLLGPEDAIISDSLNHASIIDGVRLCKAKRYVYQNNDHQDLEDKLKQADKDGARFKMIASDGVFSMDGIIANLKGLCDLADKYNALVMVDDSHAVGFIGKTGRGTHEYNDVIDRVDILTGTFGKALGGASGGYTAAKKEIVNLLRQRSRPYLFSNTLAPAIAATSIKAIELLSASTELRDQLEENTKYFRDEITKLGFDIIAGEHPIVPVMLGDAKLAQEYSRKLIVNGVYAIGFSYPVVPEGKARIRVQISAAHSKEDLDCALSAFKSIKAA